MRKSRWKTSRQKNISREKLLIAAGEKEEWKQRPVNEKVWNPAGKRVLYEICESRSHRRGAGNRRNRAGIKEKKETTKEKKQKKIKT